MHLVDTHCHLGTVGEEALESLFENAKKCGVTKMITIGAGEGIESAKKAISLADRFENVWASIGIHPHDAGDWTSLETLAPLAVHPKVVAIGETGLDFYRDWAPKENQYELFKNSISFAKKHKKPLIIHCREAREEILTILQDLHAEEVGGVFHCYSEDEAFIPKVLALNFLVSFTGNITFKKAHALRAVVKTVPLEKIMVETDTPYMAPEPFRGKPSEPMHVYQVARQIAEIKELTIEEVAEVTTNNAKLLFGI